MIVYLGRKTDYESLINIGIVLVGLYLMHIHNFHWQIANGVKDVVTFGVGNSSSRHIDIRENLCQSLLKIQQMDWMILQ